MNKKIIILLAVLLFIIGSAFAYIALKQKGENQSAAIESQAAQPFATTSPTPSQLQIEQPAGIYANYDAAAVASVPGRKVLFFHAAWCPQCRNLEKTILDGRIPSGMTIFKVNYDHATDLRQKYGVTLQTTVIEIDSSGNTLKKHVAYDDPSLPAVLKALGP